MIRFTASWDAGRENWVPTEIRFTRDGEIVHTEPTDSTVRGTVSFLWDSNGQTAGASVWRGVAWTLDRRLSPELDSSCSAESNSVTVSLLAAAPEITHQPQAVSVAEGSVASFDVEVRGSGPFDYRWQQSSDDGVSWLDLPATASSHTTGPTTLADDGALYRVSVSNSAGMATSDAVRLVVLAGTCPVPPRDVAFVRDAPVPVAPLPAAYGTNLLSNPGLEEPVYVGFAPAAFGYWRFDEAVSAPTQQGIAPRTGARMLHLVGGSRDIAITGAGTASEQAQLVDLSTLAADIDAGAVRARASAWFARVAGCAQTDDAFAVHVIAFDGTPDSFATRWTNGLNASRAQGVGHEAADMTGVDGWMPGGYRIASIRHNEPVHRVGEVFDWRQVEVALDVPPGTRFLAVLVLAGENVHADEVFPEFHGHYADDAALVLEAR